jgi:hypothetical protein
MCAAKSHNDMSYPLSIELSKMPAMFAAARYAWALPNTVLGLMFAILALLSQGRVSLRQGVVEVHGGLVTWLLGRGPPFFGPAQAVTLGHVVLGRSATALDRTRVHERVHVRQYERWGPFFLPAYVLCSLWCKMRGLDPYFDNRFEVEAYRISDGEVEKG